jgi:hypothetical protein
MCAACVAQGVTYVGGAVTALQVMAVRAKSKRARKSEEAPSEKGLPEWSGPASIR